MDKQKIIEKVKNQLPYLKQKYHIKRVGIFGSIVRNDQKMDSDVDMLVEFTSPIGFFDFIRLENFLADVLNRKVDLVTKKALKQPIKTEVLNETLYV